MQNRRFFFLDHTKESFYGPLTILFDRLLLGPIPAGRARKKDVSR
jgi:hypothetical protein